MFAKFWLERLIPFTILCVTLGSSNSFAQNTGLVPPPAGTPQVSGTPFQTVTQAMDKFGVSSVAIASSGGTVGNTVNVVATPGATSFLKAEDSPAASLDALVGVASIRNTGMAGLAADGDYQGIASGAFGNVVGTIIEDGNIASSVRVSITEDAAISSGTAGLKVFAQTQDPLSVDQDASGDAAVQKVDRAGRTITTLAPAGEMWQACGTATAVTTDVAIKASVASNRIYVTDIDCKNTSTTVGPNLDFKDGTTVISVGAIAANSATGVLNSSFVKTFTVPRRLTSATAFNFATNAATSSVTCCAGGYISVN